MRDQKYDLHPTSCLFYQISAMALLEHGSYSLPALPSFRGATSGLVSTKITIRTTAIMH